jgi:uncharacterized protein (TIGR02611 family)
MSEQPRSKWADKLEERRERYQERGKAYRFAFVTVGLAVTLAGIAMLVLPGPAFVIIPIGLAMEFAWAEAALEKALLQAEKAQDKAKEADARQKIFAALAVALVAAAVVAGIFYWDINLPVINPA